MQKRILVEIGPDRLKLAFAAVSFGDESRIELAVQMPEGQRMYHFYVSGIQKPAAENPNKEFVIKGNAAYWNHVPMGHGDSHEHPKEVAVVHYDPQTRKGELILGK